MSTTSIRGRARARPAGGINRSRRRQRIGVGTTSPTLTKTNTAQSSSFRGSRTCRATQPAPATTPLLCTISSKGAMAAMAAATRLKIASWGRSTACCWWLKPQKRQSEKLVPWPTLSQRQAASPTRPWAINTLSTSNTAGMRSTVKLRSRPVTGSAWPKGEASRAGSQKLQLRAKAVAEATMAAVSTTRRVVRGQRSNGSSSPSPRPISSCRGSSPSTGKLLRATPLKGSSIKPRACTSR